MQDRVIEIKEPGEIAVVYDRLEFEALGDGWTIIHTASKGTMSVYVAYKRLEEEKRHGYLQAH